VKAIPGRSKLAAIFSENGLRRYFKNTAWLMTQRALTILMSLLVSVLTARHLGPSDFGLLMFALNFVTLFTVLCSMGLPRILERDLVRDSNLQKTFVSTAFTLVIISAVAVYTILAIVILSRSYEDLTTILLFIIGLKAFLQVNTILEAYLLSGVKGKPLAIATFIAMTISNGIKVCFILFDAPLYIFAFGFVLDPLMILIILLISLKNGSGFPTIKGFSLSSGIYLLKQSWPYILTGLFTTLYIKMDVVMIREILGNESAGHYSAASRISEGIYVFPLIIVASLYPAIVNSKKRGQDFYERRIGNLYSLMIYSALAISVVITIGSALFIDILYGDQYAESAGVLAIHIWGSVFVFLSMSSARWLLTEHLQKIQILNTCIGAVSNILLNLYLIPIYGINGAAVATILSWSLSGYLTFAFWKSTRANFKLMTLSFCRLPTLVF